MSDEDYPNYPKAYGVGETKLGPWVGFGRPGGGFGVEVLSEMRQNRSSVGGENAIIGNVMGWILIFKVVKWFQTVNWFFKIGVNIKLEDEFYFLVKK